MQKKIPKLDQAFYRKVKEIANKLYTDNTVEYDKVEYFVAMCYTEAVITCLNSEDLIEFKETNKQTGISE